ncbi:MAG: histidine kinase [Chitinophagales bacterium]|nr:histidine kinase [Chitinophagales bacterium]
MTLQKRITIALSIGVLLLVFRIIYNDAQSELPITLNMGIGITILYSVWLFLYERNIISNRNVNSKYLYLFYIVSIPLLIYLINIYKSEAGWQMDVFAILLTIIIFHILFTWFYNKWKTIQELKNEKAKAQLEQLKNQVNPHFFFNTLNRLYALIKSDPDQAQDYVLKLSDMMRFTIYKGKEDEVLLKDEIAYLENYIALQSSRYHKPVQIDFKKEISDPNLPIAPLLNIVLLENAFKHGVETTIENAFVSILLLEKDQQFEIKIQNKYEALEATDNPGIGLNNLQKRLQILYPDKHELELNKETLQTFEATLKLDLS